MALHEAGVLEKYGVELIGASIEAIERGENREQFKEIVEELGGEVAPQRRSATRIGRLPRGGRRARLPGGGAPVVHDGRHRLRAWPTTRPTCAASPAPASHASPTTEVLLEESILGWKEYELEVMRDTGRQRRHRLLDREPRPDGRAHRRLDHRRAGDDADRPRVPAACATSPSAIIRAVGVDTGGCNIQFAVEPGTTAGSIVIEMNPRVSRSSALASKATGFPIAKIAAKVAIGYTLDEIPNDITRETPASFEPTLDYVVVKVPRFAFEKFPGADPTLTTHMKSVGEAMAIGRNFTEALQKALRSLEKQGRRRSTGASEWVDLDKAAPARGDQRSRTTAGSRRSWTRSGPARRPRRSSRPPGSTRGSSTSCC